MASLYSSYTYEHPNFLVRFPHQRRLKLLMMHIRSKPVHRWLDYGAGDGAVYRYLDQHGPISDAVLYETDDCLFDQAIENIGLTGKLRDPTIVKNLSEIDGEFDLITAFEVLEHLPLPERNKFFETVAEHLTPGGRVLIEVPVEHGPILLLKEYGRAVLKGRRSNYELTELAMASVLGRVRDRYNRYDANDTRTFISPHHGFDLARFRKELEQQGSIVKATNSPFPPLPTWLNQCVIYELTFRRHLH